MTIEEFRASPLPNIHIKMLITAHEAYMEWKLLMKLNSNNTALKDLILAREIYFNHILMGNDCITYDDIIVDTFAKDRNVYESCISYAKECISKNATLTSEDIIRINEAFLHNTAESLTAPIPESCYNDSLIWEILKDLYNPKSEFPKMIELAIAIYRLYTLSKEYEQIDIKTLSVLASYILADNENLIVMSKAWIVLFDGSNKSLIGKADYMVFEILCAFSFAFADSIKFTKLIQDKTMKMQIELKSQLPKLYSEKLAALLGNSFCLRNSLLESELDVSLKTAISYLKELSEKRFLKAVKVSKGLYYFNTFFYDALQECGEQKWREKAKDI